MGLSPLHWDAVFVKINLFLKILHFYLGTYLPDVYFIEFH